MATDVVTVSRALLSVSRVIQPQLIRLFENLSPRPEAPFLDVPNAESWILNRVPRGSDGGGSNNAPREVS